MERVSLLNGITKIQDYELTALGVSLTTGGVYEGLKLTNTGGNNRSISIGKALVLCEKTAGNKVLAHYELTTVKTFSQVGPFKVWIAIDQGNIDNPTENTSTGTGAGAIAYGASYPADNFLALGEVNGSNVITVQAETVSSNVAKALLTVIQSGGANFFALTTGVSNSYEATYTKPVPATGTVSGIAQDIVYYIKADKTNTGNATISINTTLGTLTASLKKMNDLDVSAGDIEAGLLIGFMWNGTEFQMITPTAKAPAGTTTTISTNGVVGETGGSVAGKPAFVGTGIKDTRILSQTSGATTLNFGNGTDIRLEQAILVNDHNLLRSVKVNLKKIGSPADNIIVRALDKNRNVLATSTTTLAGGTVTGSYVSYTFMFPYTTLTANEFFELDFSRSGGQDAVNYYQIESVATYEYPHGQIEQFNGTDYTYRDGSLLMTVQFGRAYESGKRYLCDTDYLATSSIDGFFEQTKVYNDNCFVTLSGANNNQLGLTPGSNYYLDTLKGDKNIVHNTDTFFGYLTTNQEKIAQQINIGSGLTVSKIIMNFYRTGTPIDTMLLRIETDNNNNEPSGTLVHANATITINPLELTTSSNGRIDIFNFPGSFNLDAGTKYWIVLTRSGAVSSTNYYRSRIQNTSVYTYGLYKTYENAVWTTRTNSMFFSFVDSYNGLDINQYGERAVASPASDDLYFGYSRTDNAEVAQMMMTDTDTTIDEISLHLKKDGAPTDNMEIRIETNINEQGTTINGDFGNTNQNETIAVGTTTDVKQAGSFTATDAFRFQQMDLYLSLNNNPTDGLTVRLETDNAGVPSGTLIDPNATVTIANMNTFVNAGAGFYAIIFPQAVQVTAIKFWIVLSRTGALDNANYVNTRRYTVQTLSSTQSTWNGTVWSGASTKAITAVFGASYMQCKPSGILIDPNATISVAGTSLSTSYKFTKLTFPGSFTIPKNTIFWVRMRRSDVRNYSTTNFYRVRSNTSGTYGYGYSLVLENRSRADALYSRNMVLFFNTVYNRAKFVRKDTGVIFLGRSLSPTQIRMDKMIVGVPGLQGKTTSNYNMTVPALTSYDYSVYVTVSEHSMAKLDRSLVGTGSMGTGIEISSIDQFGAETVVMSASTTGTASGTERAFIPKGTARIRQTVGNGAGVGQSRTSNVLLTLVSAGLKGII